MSNHTRQSLLQRAKLDPSSEAWFQLVEIYEPLTAGWVMRAGVSDSDVGDITQEVMLVLAQEIGNFDHNGRLGAFRRWLKLITINRCRRYWDKNKRHVTGSSSLDGDSAVAFLQDLEDPSSDISRLWDKEHDAYVLERMVQLVQREFDDRDYDVFLRNTVQGESAKAISSEFGITVGTVYKIKFRVLTRLKEAAAGLLDAPEFDIGMPQSQR